MTDVNPLIGSLKKGDRTVAVLTRAGQWISDDQVLLARLKIRWSVGRTYALGLPLGWSALSQAAADVGAKAVFTDKLQPLPEGAVS